jgi:hypothetical protein
MWVGFVGTNGCGTVESFEENIEKGNGPPW